MRSAIGGIIGNLLRNKLGIKLRSKLVRKNGMIFLKPISEIILYLLTIL